MRNVCFFTLFLSASLALACGSSGDPAPSDAAAAAGSGGSTAAGAGGQSAAGKGGAAGAPQGGATQGGQAGAISGGASGAGGSTSAGSSGGGQAGAGGAGAGGSAGAGAGGAGAGGSAGVAASMAGGLIVIASIPPNAALPDGRGLVTASFFDAQPSACERTTVGDCTLTRCPTPTAGPSAAPPDAGDVTVDTGFKVALLSPGTGVEPNTYATYTSQSSLYSGGESIDVDAKGGSVPAFSTTLFAPDTVTFSKPYTKSGDTLTLDSAKDYLCEWSQTQDDVRFGVTMKDATAGGSFDLELSCTFDGAKAQGTVPQALLAQLPKKAGSLSVSARNQVVVKAGKYDVTVRALAPAYGPTGASITSDVTIK